MRFGAAAMQDVQADEDLGGSPGDSSIPRPMPVSGVYGRSCRALTVYLDRTAHMNPCYVLMKIHGLWRVQKLQWSHAHAHGLMLPFARERADDTVRVGSVQVYSHLVKRVTNEPSVDYVTWSCLTPVTPKPFDWLTYQLWDLFEEEWLEPGQP